MKAPIEVWRFKDAPKAYRDLSGRGGDEDWLAVLPEYLAGEDVWIPWMDEASPFGCCCVSRHALPDGRVVVIGAHA